MRAASSWLASSVIIRARNSTIPNPTSRATITSATVISAYFSWPSQSIASRSRPTASSAWLIGPCSWNMKLPTMPITGIARMYGRNSTVRKNRQAGSCSYSSVARRIEKTSSTGTHSSRSTLCLSASLKVGSSKMKR